MAESNPLNDQNTALDDVAALYSWANLHGAKYRDFSASRAQSREMARLRAEQAGAEAERQLHQDAGSAPTVAVEQSAPDQFALAREAQQQQVQEKQGEGLRALELRAQDERAQDERAQEERAQEERAQEERAQEQPAAEQRTLELRDAEERAAEQQAEKQRALEQWDAGQRTAAQQAEDQRAAAVARQAELEAVAAAERARRAEWEQLVAAQLAARRSAEDGAHREAQQAADRAARLQAEQSALQALQQAEEQASRQAAESAAQQAKERAAVLAADQAAELARQKAVEEAEKQVAEQAAQEAMKEAAMNAAAQASEQAAAETRRQASLLAAQQAAERAAEHAAQQGSQQRAWQRPADRFPAAPPMPYIPPQDYASYARAHVSHPSTEEWPARPGEQTSAGQNGQRAAGAPPSRQASHGQTGQAHFGPGQEESMRPEASASHNPWVSEETNEPASRPAWLDTGAELGTGAEENRVSAPPHSPMPSSPLSASAPLSAAPLPTLPTESQLPPAGSPAAPEDTLQASRDRLTSRWFALRGVFDGNVTPIEPILAPSTLRPPAMAVFSLAGGVGKTSLVATLGRALSARGERVLLVDTAAFGLLPFFFGATDQRPGVLRTFTPPGISTDAPIQMVTLDPEGVASETPGRTAAQESLSGEIAKFAQGAGRVIVDLATASGATTRRIMRMAPLMLVPVIPDMNSVVSVSSIDAFFEHNGPEQNGSLNGSQPGKTALPYYVLNQFDASLPLHLDVREVLSEQLGERLLPFALRRAPAMSEALAEGMTVLDYAPGSPLAEDFNTLAGWVKSLSAPATTTYRGVRWSEK